MPRVNKDYASRSVCHLFLLSRVRKTARDSARIFHSPEMRAPDPSAASRQKSSTRSGEPSAVLASTLLSIFHRFP